MPANPGIRDPEIAITAVDNKTYHGSIYKYVPINPRSLEDCEIN